MGSALRHALCVLIRWQVPSPKREGRLIIPNQAFLLPGRALPGRALPRPKCRAALLRKGKFSRLWGDKLEII